MRIQTCWVFRRSKYLCNLNGTCFCYFLQTLTSPAANRPVYLKVLNSNHSQIYVLSIMAPKQLCKTPKGVGGLTTFHLRQFGQPGEGGLGWRWFRRSKSLGFYNGNGILHEWICNNYIVSLWPFSGRYMQISHGYTGIHGILIGNCCATIRPRAVQGTSHDTNTLTNIPLPVATIPPGK